MDFPHTKQIMPRQTVATLVDTYNTAIKEVREAHRLWHSAETQTMAQFGSRHLFVAPYRRMKPIEDIEKQITADAWKHILRQTGIANIATKSRFDKMINQVRKSNMPAITVENIMGILAGLHDDLPDIMREAVREVFSLLTPRGRRYKTNNPYKVGRKVILTGYGLSRSFPWDRQELVALDNAFHLLDGQGIAKYPNDLPTIVDNAIRHGERQCETKYFRCRWYAKGTMHVELLRHDLVQELNRIGSQMKRELDRA